MISDQRPHILEINTSVDLGHVRLPDGTGWYVSGSRSVGGLRPTSTSKIEERKGYEKERRS